MEEPDHVVSAFNDAHAALGNLYPFFSTLFIHYLPYYIDWCLTSAQLWLMFKPHLIDRWSSFAWAIKKEKEKKKPKPSITKLYSSTRVDLNGA